MLIGKIVFPSQNRAEAPDRGNQERSKACPARYNWGCLRELCAIIAESAHASQYASRPAALEWGYFHFFPKKIISKIAFKSQAQSRLIKAGRLGICISLPQKSCAFLCFQKKEGSTTRHEEKNRNLFLIKGLEKEFSLWLQRQFAWQ